MRIGMFLDSYYPKIGGVATSVVQLKKGLEKLGHEVFIITGGNVRVPVCNDHVVLLPSIDTEWWNIGIINPFSKTNLEFLKNLHLDLVHTHTELTVGLLGNSLAKCMDLPNVHSYHTSYEYYKHYVFKNFCGLGDKVESFVVHNFCGENKDELITPSEKIVTYLRDHYGITRDFWVIRTGIDYDLSNRLECSDSF